MTPREQLLEALLVERFRPYPPGRTSAERTRRGQAADPDNDIVTAQRRRALAEAAAYIDRRTA